jgi:ribosome-associated protein
MIFITPDIHLGDHEIEFSAVQAQGPGGQHVNKTSSAIQLRFDVRNSSLPQDVKRRLLARADQRITKDGVIVIKAQDERSQLRNKEEAIQRLTLMIRLASKEPRKRIPTKPSKSSVQKRLDQKTQQSKVKKLRKSPIS